MDPSLAGALADVLPGLADEIVAEIVREVPEYRQPMEGAFGRGVRRGVGEALAQFVALVGGSSPAEPVDGSVYRALGRGELRAGRGLDALQAAYRLGARVSWRRVAAAARGAGADAEQLSLLAESVFAYIDEISAQSVEGYAQAQAAAAGEQQRRRERLVRMMVAPEMRPDEAALRAAALEAGWTLPRRIVALVAEAQDGRRVSGRLDTDVISAQVGDLRCVLVPDGAAPGRRRALTRACAGVAAAVGPEVSPLDARVSFARAREALRLNLLGAIAGPSPIVAEEHLGALLLLRDRRLLEELARRRLAPLHDLTAAARARLEETVLAWLRHQGSVPAVAEELGIHRQTVRYRLGRARELLGDALDQPDARLELELALRGKRLLALAGAQAALDGGDHAIGPVSTGPAPVGPQV